MWRMPRIELNGEGEPVWLTEGSTVTTMGNGLRQDPWCTPTFTDLRDPQPEGERERVSDAQINRGWDIPG